MQFENHKVIRIALSLFLAINKVMKGTKNIQRGMRKFLKYTWTYTKKK
jgi:hypothetical protein